MRRSTATGWPLEVIIKSVLPADFSHSLTGFFFSSLTEIVLTAAPYPKRGFHATDQLYPEHSEMRRHIGICSDFR